MTEPEHLDTPFHVNPVVKVDEDSDLPPILKESLNRMAHIVTVQRSLIRIEHNICPEDGTKLVRMDSVVAKHVPGCQCSTTWLCSAPKCHLFLIRAPEPAG